MARLTRHLILVLSLVALVLAATAGPASAHQAKVVVRPGESIQAAVDAADPGQTITVLAGSYRENVAITKDGITLRGRGARLEPPAAPEPNACSEPGQPATIGICVLGQINFDTGEVLRPVEDVTISGFRLRDFPDSGILAFGAKDATFAHNVALDDDEYGLTAFTSTGTRMLFNRASGAEEAGFYIGDSPQADATLVGNIATDSRFGILWRNAEGGSAVHNRVHGNCVGIMVLSGIEGLPGTAGGLSMRANVIRANTRPCEASEEGPALSGVGIAIAGAHDNRVIGNLITGNVPPGETAFSGGVAVVRDFLGAAPNDNLIKGNVVLNNDPDLFWDGSGSGNRFRHNLCRTSDPAGLCSH
jgi:parallel beta helix pectate lyase-like protein